METLNSLQNLLLFTSRYYHFLNYPTPSHFASSMTCQKQKTDLGFRKKISCFFYTDSSQINANSSTINKIRDYLNRSRCGGLKTFCSFRKFFRHLWIDWFLYSCRCCESLLPLQQSVVVYEKLFGSNTIVRTFDVLTISNAFMKTQCRYSLIS